MGQRTRVAGLAAALAVGIAAAAAAARPAQAPQDEPPPKPAPAAPAAPQAPAPAEPKAAIDDPTRAARLAADVERDRALVAAVDRYGRLDEYGAAMRKLLDRATDRFIDVGDGVFTDVAVQSWLEWNDPKEGGPVLPGLDKSATNHPFTTILDLDRQLRSHGIDFLVVTFPTRPQLYPELFMPSGSLEGLAGYCPATSRLALALAEAGVEVLYLAPEFVAARYGKDGDTKDQLYLRYNQHWTPRAAEMTARIVADRIAKYPWFQPGKAKEGIDWETRPKDVSVSIVFGGGPQNAKPELLHATQVIRPKSNQKLDSVRPSSPIVLLSGSFADFHGVHHADFTSQLYRFTGWPIDKINPKGGIEDACRQALADRPDAEVRKKKLVIWMLAEQAFRTGPMWAPIPIFDE